jgi:hypothetical protein
VAAVATEHSGDVGAANAPGGGALFSMRLPLVPRGANLDEEGLTARTPDGRAHRPGGSLRL